MKNTITEILNAGGEFNDRVNLIEDGISKLKDRTDWIIQNAA